MLSYLCVALSALRSQVCTTVGGGRWSGVGRSCTASYDESPWLGWRGRNNETALVEREGNVGSLSSEVLKGLVVVGEGER
jgi:hypothetical protein